MDDQRERFLIRYAGSFAPFTVARAEGAWVETTDGRRILDFTSGQICSTVGHNHPHVTAALRRALDEVVHLNSWMLSEPVLALAERLAGLFPAPLEKVILLNTGSEANEVALKLAKRYSGRFEVAGLTRSFHGLLSGISSVNFSFAHAGYGPLLPGAFALPAPYAYRCPVRHCNGSCDCTCLEVGFDLLDEQSVGSLCAAIAEPVLSAGGVIVPPDGYFQRLRELCDERGLLLLFDEVQVGIGRTGTLFAYQHEDVEPDIMTLAKALGGGVPIGAMLATEKIAAVLGPGAHGSTFGGNPLACAAGGAVVRALLEDGVLDNCRAMSERIRQRIEAMRGSVPMIREVRGLGLILGLELDRPGRPLVAAALERGLVINCTADKVIRLLPPLTITAGEVDEGLAILEDVLCSAR